MVLPWPLRRRCLEALYGWRIARSAKIGVSLIGADFLELAGDSRIGHANVIRRLRRLRLGEFAVLGHFNWIYGDPQAVSASGADSDAHSELSLGRHSALTKRHLVDCSGPVRIGDFTTVAGSRSQLITHGIDVSISRQRVSPIEIGAYCLVGTNVTLLGGAVVPPRCVIAAGAVVTGELDVPVALYGGVPARLIKQLDPEAKYFMRTEGRVEW